MERLLLGLALLAAPLAAQDDMGIARGTVPEAVAIEDLDGNAVDLGQWIGQGPVLFEFWATWCPLCTRLEPQLLDLHRRYGERVAFVAIAVGVNQTPRSIKRHLERHTLPWPTLFDGRGRAVRAFQAFTTSFVVVLDAEGRVVYTGSGADQDLAPVLAALVPSP
ncbi:MAG: TlpA disulfide reductase family protein [Gemmatimonadales bacterium]